MTLTEEKERDINNRISNEQHAKVSVTNSLGGASLKKGMFIIGSIDELSDLLNDLQAIRDIIKDETGLWF